MSAVEQNVTAVAGFSYGAIGADIHVFGDGTPLYLTEVYQQSARPDPGWLRELPSRMLDGRSQLVPFTGRDAEVADLDHWLGGPSRLAVRWLLGSGGQGKTRLAEHIAAHAYRLGWKVVVAVQGVGAVQPSPGSQDLRTQECRGVLLLVDYADRWPLTTLLWLTRNSLLHQPGVSTRVLLCARGSTNWRALRGVLEKRAAAHASSMKLEPLPETAREAMYRAAYEGFAGVYLVADPTAAEPTVTLADDRFGLTLAVHLAALVAVDAQVHHIEPITDPAKLTQYLLDREHGHWTRLYEGGARALDFATPPSVMARTVFTAALTGPLSPIAGGMGRALTPAPGTVPELGERVSYSSLAESYRPADSFPPREDTPWTHGGPPVEYEPTDEDAYEEWS